MCVSVFQLQCAADAAGLLSVPADQQHWQAGPHATDPAHLPAAGGVATSGAVRQRRPLCHLQCHVSTALWETLHHLHVLRLITKDHGQIFAISFLVISVKLLSGKNPESSQLSIGVHSFLC